MASDGNKLPASLHLPAPACCRQLNAAVTLFPELDPPEPLRPTVPLKADAPADVATLPLAERLRPRHLGEVIGQAHLLAAGRPLRTAFDRGRPHSMILWGPPGVGKTTLARLLSDGFNAHFIAISAVLGGVKEIREAVEQARAQQATGQRTIVFVDEVHRFNKAQQDAFLPHVEAGLFTFVGATTENPAFEVNQALLSRATVHVLHSLDAAELGQVLDRAAAVLAAPPLSATARDRLVAFADGDARRLINAYETVAAGHAGAAEIDEAALEQSLGEWLRRYDKGGDVFYDTISALHKSVRGSDPDAALYWFVRMLDGGADPRYIARRLIRMASEDIGLADPRALPMTLDAAAAYERLGSPEGELMLAQALVFLAVAPKSNAVYKALGEVREWVSKDSSRPVPPHLRNAPTRLATQLGHGAGYRYAHDEPDGFAAGASYWPEGMRAQRWYRPVDRGLETQIGERLRRLADAQRAARQEPGGADADDPGKPSN
jgi:putative ATPase